MTGYIFKWDLSELYDEAGHGLGPFDGSSYGRYDGTFFHFNNNNQNAGKTWTEGLKSDRNCSEFISGNGNINRFNQLITFTNYGDFKQVIVDISGNSATNGNILYLYPIDPSLQSLSFAMKPTNQSTPNKGTISIETTSTSLWPPSLSSANLSLSNNTIGPSQPTGTIVGLFSTSRINSDDFKYTITGGTNISSFQINGTKLVTSSMLSSGTYNVMIKSERNPNCNPNHTWGTTLASDPTNLYTVYNSFNITVLQGDHITGIGLSSYTLLEGQPINTLIGNLSSQYSNSSVSPSYTYSIVKGDGFNITNGDELVSNKIFNYSQYQSLSIDIQSSTTVNSNTSTFTQTFIIDILPLPANYDLCMNSIYWNSDISLNYYEDSDQGFGLIQVLNSMGNANLVFNRNMKIGLIAAGGGGGGGEGRKTTSIFSGGGGGGASALQLEFDVFSDMSFNLSVGSKGYGSTSSGQDGSATLIYSDTSYGIIDISAGGGYGGASQNSIYDGSGGLLYYNFSPSLGRNFAERIIYDSSGYEISKGGINIDSASLGGIDISSVGQSGSPANSGYASLPGRINFLGNDIILSGGGGAGYFDTITVGNPSGEGGSAGNGYGGFGGKILAPSSNSLLVAGVSAEIFGAGGGGAGSNYNTDVSPPDYVKGGDGGDGIILIYYQIPPNTLNEYYFPFYTFIGSQNIHINPVRFLPQDILSLDISGVDFLDIDSNGIITNTSQMTEGDYEFEVIMTFTENIPNNYEFFSLKITNIIYNQYYSSYYNFSFNTDILIAPNTTLPYVYNIYLIGAGNQYFSIDNNGIITNNNATIVPAGSYNFIIGIIFSREEPHEEQITIDIPRPDIRDYNGYQTIDMNFPSVPQIKQEGAAPQILFTPTGNGNPLIYPNQQFNPGVWASLKTLPDYGASARDNVLYQGWIQYISDGLETYNNITAFTSGEGGYNWINCATSKFANQTNTIPYPNNDEKAFIVALKPGEDKKNILNFYPIRPYPGSYSMPVSSGLEGVSFNFYDNADRNLFESSFYNIFRLTKSSIRPGGTIWPPAQDQNNLALTNNIMGNNVPENTMVGVLSTSEITSTDFMYSIIGGDKSDNFYINGSNLYTSQTLSPYPYTVIIQSSLNPNANPNNSWGQVLPPDAANGWFDVSNTFSITVPTGPSILGLALNGNTITEKQTSGTPIGTFIPSLSSGWSYPYDKNYTLVGESSNFQIVGSELQTLSVLNYINAQYYTINVQVTVGPDSNNNIAYYTESFFIDVLPEMPNYDVCMNSKYWSSDVSVNYYEDASKGVVQILPNMGPIQLKFKHEMRGGFIAVGAGGGGGGGQQNSDTSPNSIFSGGGGGGGSIYKLELDLFQDMSFNLSAGNKGNGGTGRNSGQDGSATLIYSDTTFGTIDITAGGGNGGTARTSQPDGSGGILVSNISANTGFNFEERELFISSGYEISKGGDNNDSDRMNPHPSDLTIVGQDGSGAVPGIQQIPGRVTFLGVQAVFSGGGGGGYFDISSILLGSTDGLGGEGGSAGNGYGGFGGKILTDSSSSPLIAGISAEIFGAGGGGGGSNYSLEYNNPPDFVKGGFGGDGVILIYYQIPPNTLNEYYFTEYEFLVNSNIIIDPYIALPPDISSIEISGADFLNIDEKGIITNNIGIYPQIGTYNFEVIIDSVSLGMDYEFITLDISNIPFNQYYNSSYIFKYEDAFSITPNTVIQNIANIGLSTNERSLFNIDITGKITLNTKQSGNYYMTVSILFNDGSVDSEYFEVNIGSKPGPPNLPTTGGPIRICDTKFRSCNNITKSLPGTSGNVVITGLTQSEILKRLVEMQTNRRGARWVKRNAPTNGYGSRSGAPHGYGSSPKNDLS